MLDSIRIRTASEQIAAALAEEELARFQPSIVLEGDRWEVRVESETEDDLPDVLSILYRRLQGPDPAIDVLVNGERYSPGHGL